MEEGNRKRSLLLLSLLKRVLNMALSLLFFGLNRYSIIDSFRRDYSILL